jgi:hypothetical protein
MHSYDSNMLTTSSNLPSFSHSYNRRVLSTIAFALYFLHIKVFLAKTDAFTSLAKEEEECVSTHFIQCS